MWRTYPCITFRSVLGLNLRRVACIQRSLSNCSDCCLKGSCAYAFFFESHIAKDTLLKGRIRAPHPFVLKYDALDDTHCRLRVVYMGQGVNFLPYVTLALEKAGERGIEKERVPFHIDCQRLNGQVSDYSLSSINQVAKVWPDVAFSLRDSFQLRLETPCRIQVGGSLQAQATPDLLVKSMQGRLRTLFYFYDKGEDLSGILNNGVGKLSYETLSLGWKEYSYYSSRQRTVMKLGGAVGVFALEGTDDVSLTALLEALTLFNVGKNTSFGLGRVSIEGVRQC